MPDKTVGGFPLGKLNNDPRGEIALAVSVHENKVRVDFGKKIDWIAMDKAHLDIFIATLTEMGKRLV
jgi:hypothetical protein